MQSPTFAEYAARRRAYSTEQVAQGRRPALRLLAPAVPPPSTRLDRNKNERHTAGTSWTTSQTPVALVERDRRALTVHTGLYSPAGHSLSAGELVHLSIASLVETLDNAGVIVTRDRLTARRLVDAVRAVDKNPRWDSVAATLAQRLEVMLTGASSRLIIITEALERRLWAPEGVETYEQWAAALGGDPASPLDVLTPALLGKLEGLSTQLGFARQAVENEHRAIQSTGGLPSPYLAVRAYGATNLSQTAWEAYRSIDPIGTVEARCAGTAVTATVYEMDRHEVLARLSLPCRLKAGKSVRILDSENDEVGLAELKELRMDDQGRLVGVFGSSERTRTTSKGHGALLAAALGRSGATFGVVEEPFLSASPASSTSPWLGSKGETRPRIVRDVPLDIALAGGST